MESPALGDDADDDVRLVLSMKRAPEVRLRREAIVKWCLLWSGMVCQR